MRSQTRSAGASRSAAAGSARAASSRWRLPPRPDGQGARDTGPGRGGELSRGRGARGGGAGGGGARQRRARGAARGGRPRRPARAAPHACGGGAPGMKARKVTGLDPEGPLEKNLRRIVSVRLQELRSFGPEVGDPNAVKALHDMRIAAKRLRYVLEMGEPVLGAPARRGAKEMRRIQDLLGELHDCDEGVPRVPPAGEPLGGQ